MQDGRTRVVTVGGPRRLSASASIASRSSRTSARGGVPVASISIRNLDDRVRELLRVRAAQHGRSMESEIRSILADAVGAGRETGGLFHAVLDRFGEIGGVELELPPRATPVRAAEFS